MNDFFWKIDEQKFNYADKSLLLNGWYVHLQGKEGRLELVGNEKDRIAVLTPRRIQREDVVSSRPEFSQVRNPGFSVCIPEILKFMNAYELLEVFFLCETEKVCIWKAACEQLKREYEDRKLEYRIDSEEFVTKDGFRILGWAADWDEKTEIAVTDDKERPLECEIKRSYRPDVAKSLGLEHSEEEYGFELLIPVKRRGCAGVFVVVRAGEREKKHYVDIKKKYKDSEYASYILNTLRHGKWKQNVRIIQERGVAGFAEYAYARTNYPEDSYQVWRLEHAASVMEMKKQRKTVFPYQPLVSIVIPLYNTPLDFFKELLDSVKNQTYSKWQLCLADGSENGEALDFLKKHYRHEKRVSYRRLKENKGISENTNAALRMARGDYIVFCDHDDVLAPDALYEIVKAINQNQKPDALYTDEDKVSMDGKKYFEPNFKPDFNLFFLRSNNYICHIFAVKRELLKKAGMLRSEFDGAQDFDFVLRCCEQADKIIHIPKALYHWRCHAASTAADPSSKSYAYIAGKHAVEAHYKRLKIPARVEMSEAPGCYRSIFEVQGSPLISIIIPNKDHTQDLELCLSSMKERSTYKNYEVLIVENNSTEEETFRYYETLTDRYPNARVLTWSAKFNYSAINNFAVTQAKGEYLLFLNNDVEILTPEWMEEMLGICQQKQVGIVGAKLYYPDDTIQHAGVVLGLGGVAGHVMCRALRSNPGYVGRLINVQEMSAVTAACMLVKAETFARVRGFDEILEVAFNDVDFCMKVRKEGYLVVFTPYAELYHYESKSRGSDDTPEKKRRFAEEVEYFRSKWEEELQAGDPYYNPNLSLTREDCSLKEKEGNEKNNGKGDF